MKPLLSIIIPAYNEANNFKDGVLNPSLAWLQKQKFDYEVIFVNDGSTDDTGKLLTAFCRAHKNFRLLTVAHAGKATAVKSGVLAAKGALILFCDFDQATPLTVATKFIQEHENGADVVIGDRTSSRSGKSDTFFQKIRSDILVILAKIILGISVNDTQCGFKSLTSIAAKKIFNSFKVSAQPGTVVGGYMGAFDIELLFLAGKFGYKITQVPVSREDPYGALGKYNNKWREPIMMTRDILKVRLFDLLGRYNS